tara:strand:+ start:48002 stop:49204 length:1203 start_codon:yes stop_codon:yes gene_type:complete
MFVKLIKYLLSIFYSLLKFFIKKRNIILINAHHPELYCDNTKYLFEYLSLNTSHEIYWISKNNDVIKYLKKNGYKSLDIRKIRIYLYSLYLLSKSKVIINNGTKYFNPIKLKLDDIIKITTFHGNGPKTVTTPSIESDEISDVNQFDYINFTSDYLIEKCAQEIYHIPNNKLIKLGYPRCDQFFDSDYVQDSYNKKNITNELLNYKYDGKGKIILYTPTWRPYKYNFPLFMLNDLNNIDQLNQYYLENDIYFFYSVHSAFNVPKNLPEKERVILIDSINEHHLYDTNSFMLEVDILINDYSTTSTDFALLNRPQIFFMPDYERYEKEKGFIEDYRECMPGKEVTNLTEFTSTIDLYLSNPDLYRSDYKSRIDKYLINYYDLKKGNSSELFTSFINSLIID